MDIGYIELNIRPFRDKKYSLFEGENIHPLQGKIVHICGINSQVSIYEDILDLKFQRSGSS